MAENVKVPPLDEAPVTVVGSTPQSEFAFDFPFWVAADVLVYVDNVLLETDAYTVEGLLVQNGDPVEGGYGSGVVTLNAAVSNCTVTIDRFVVGARLSQFSRAAPLGMPSLNSDFNKQTARDQDIVRRLARALLVPYGDEPIDPSNIVEAAQAVAAKTDRDAGNLTVDNQVSFRNVLSPTRRCPEDFGAKGDYDWDTNTGTDDTDAINLWLEAGRVEKYELYLNNRSYRVTEPLFVASLSDGFTINGTAPLSCRIVNTTEPVAGVLSQDELTIGTPDVGIRNVKLSNFSVMSRFAKTGGWAIICHDHQQGVYENLYPGGGNYVGRDLAWSGLWLSGYLKASLINVQFEGQGTGFKINGKVANVGVNAWLTDCNFGFGQIGIHIAGGVGGFFAKGVEVLSNTTYGWLIDNAGAAAQNREIQLSSTCVIDGGGASGSGMYVNDTLATFGSSIMNNAFMGSYTNGLHVVRWDNGSEGGQINVGATRIFNCVDAVRVENARPRIDIAATLNGNSGRAINATVATTNITHTGKAESNAGGNYNQNANIGTWTAYTPNVGAVSGTITTSSASGRYRLDGRTCHFSVSVTVTTNGTGASALLVDLPAGGVAAFRPTLSVAFSGRENNTSGSAVVGVANPSNSYIAITTYNNGYPAASGAQITLSGSYEVAG